MKLWLTPTEVEELTGRSRPSAQLRALEHMGYEYRLRGDGTFVVPIFQFKSTPEKPVLLNLETLNGA